MKTKIILSTVATLALLLGGCSEGNGTEGGGNTGTANTGTQTAQTPGTANNAVTNSGSQDGQNSDADATENANPEETSGDSADTTAENTENNTNPNTGVISGGTDNGNGTGSDDDGSSTGDNTGDSYIPGPGNGADIHTTSSKTGGWFARTEVSATDSNGKVYTHTTAGVFGELIDSKDAKDQHDIPGYGPAVLQVIFQPDFDTDVPAETGYFSDYKKYSGSSAKKETWTFQVVNQHTVDLKDAPISIKLEGTYDLSYKKVKGKVSYEEKQTPNTEKAAELTLVDVDNGNTYTVEELKTANLSMEGKHTRTFRWVLGTVANEDYTAVETSPNIKAEAFNESGIKANNISTASFSTKAGGKFGLPPQ